ncbi:MAG: DUF1080 domain-containing protein [Planctomycetes bacterium]|nr:DUF1080 domain-containing protein [Planctomycetota bacterium]NOG52789.1 DUF1080 domain-containing protein [Planctomycetota bacterium]
MQVRLQSRRLCAPLCRSAAALLICTAAAVSGCCSSTCPVNDDDTSQARPEPQRLWQVLFGDGTGLSQWVTTTGDPVIGWVIQDDPLAITPGEGEPTLCIVPGSGSIMTRETFSDFEFHLEFMVPTGLPDDVTGQNRGNSGVYIQRRYEVQILDSYGLPPGNRDCGAVYNFKAPAVNASKPAGQWQTYDITFHAPTWSFEDDGSGGRTAVKAANARITVYHNGNLIHDDVEVPNKTGAGSPEGPEPGPILLQDHGNAVRFRNIRIRELQYINH